jgi:hypothetical protein
VGECGKHVTQDVNQIEREGKEMSNKRIFLLIIILAYLVAASACSTVKTAQAFNQTGNDFLIALKGADYTAGYNLFVAELQQKVGAVEDLQTMIEENNAQPSEWTFSSWNLSTDENKNNTATVEGSVTYQDGRLGTVKLELIKVGEAWKVMSFDLSW